MLFIPYNPVICMGGYLYNSFTLSERIEFFVFKEIFGSLLFRTSFCILDTKLISENTKRKQAVLFFLKVHKRQ